MLFDTGPFRGAVKANATRVDPMCGMTVDPAAAAHRRHGERDYYFCSKSCAEAFRRQPPSTLSLLASHEARLLILHAPDGGFSAMVRALRYRSPGSRVARRLPAAHRHLSLARPRGTNRQKQL
jgi:YHS domain-containing protein